MRSILVVTAYAAALTVLTYGLDAAGGHPARSAPAVLFVVWLIVVTLARFVWRRLRSMRKSAPPRQPEG